VSEQRSVVAGIEAPRRTAATGVALFPGSFEAAVAGLRSTVDTLLGGPEFVPFAAPPVIAREVVERSGYVAGFPHLLGTVHSYQDGPVAWRAQLPRAKPGGQWHASQRLTDVVLTPAACYHLYPELADGRLDGTARFTVESHCYRHEATDEIGRLRSFRMREFVLVGSAQECLAWRERCCGLVADWLVGLGLDVRTEVATDPFFGPSAKMLRSAQLTNELKYEFTAPLADGIRQAVVSANYHLDHFGQAFSIDAPSGGPAHSACVAFGLERLVLALRHLRHPG
jgi:seryl-tRNA synthetase